MIFAKNNLLGLVSNIGSNAASNAVNKFQRIISREEAVTQGKVFTLFILNADIDDIIKIIN